MGNSTAPWLYHGTARPASGRELTPRFAETVAGHRGHFVFATADPELARCYAVKNEQVVSIGRLRDDRTLYCLIHDRAAFLRDAPAGLVYKFRGATFTPVRIGPHRTDEYVSTRPQPLHRAEQIQVAGISELMERGVQILFARPGIDRERFLKLVAKSGHEPETLLAQSHVIWENSAKNINPAQGLKIPGG